MTAAGRRGATRAAAESKTVSGIKSGTASRIPSGTASGTASSTGAEKKQAAAGAAAAAPGRGRAGARTLSSRLAYEGPLFRVYQEKVIEPSGFEARRDVIRHNGSVVILAVDAGRTPRDPWIVIERQYRHAAGQYLWELPAGKKEPGERDLAAAKREMLEETGYRARKWSHLLTYFASPGFLGESMRVFLAEGLLAGEASPEQDEHIDFRLVRLSEVLAMIDAGKIVDGKTLVATQFYARRIGFRP